MWHTEHETPGCALIIPNGHTVHAREGFPARYDGTDRWLLRMMIRVRGNRSISAMTA
ncbi:MAG: hypothetical protein HY696_03200 [Deltaproteobacteria bacterium]|nr:hypothetical protein [Deltaproteobacteria bacterium]